MTGQARTITGEGFMKPLNSANAIILIALVALLAGCDQATDQSTSQQDPPAKDRTLSKETDGRALNANRIALLVTGWGNPLEPVEQYSDEIFRDAILGRQAASPNQVCTQNYVGTYPFRSEKGLLPHVIAFKTEGFEEFWDSSGIYKLNEDGTAYLSVLDDQIVLHADELADVAITPVRELPVSGFGARVFGVDPRDGTDHTADIFKIDQPNGLHDAKESAAARRLWVEKMIGANPATPPKHQRVTLELEKYIAEYIKQNFGDVIDLRFGYYGMIEGVSEKLGDVAVQFAEQGFRQMVLARETTDHNLYANDFMDLYPMLKSLCDAGYSDRDMSIQQVRQIGRTPEYNYMVVENVRPFIEQVPIGSEVTIIYATWGLPWPGGNPNAGPFSAPQPNIKETFHENAFLNFRSFKSYAQAAFDENFGGDYRLNFSKSGGVGGPNSRTNSLFAYSMYSSKDYGHSEDPLRYTTIRENLEAAIWQDKKDEIIIVLSHWYNNGIPVKLSMRTLNDLPLNSIVEMHQGVHSISWCARYAGPGDYTQMSVPEEGCPESYAHIQMTEAFDDLAQEFAVGFANRIRGGIERFNVFPDLDITIAAQGIIDRRDGGRVEVLDGPLKGAALLVHPDPRPNEPENYEWANRWRPESDGDPHTGPTAVRAINDYEQVSDYLDSAKDNFNAFIGTQRRATPNLDFPIHPSAISAVVYFGPYRTVFNAPATVTIPYITELVSDPEKIEPHIFNELTKAYDPVYPVPAGAPLRIHEQSGTASFDVQVLGNYVLTIAE